MKKVGRFWNIQGVFILLAILIILAVSTIFPETRIAFKNWSEDDQRGTFWPLLVSLSIAMLGTLITTYIFLKGALDRALDEKPYYRRVINQYRKRMMEHIWHYTIFTLLLIFLISYLYFSVYFLKLRHHAIFRLALYALVAICLAYSAYILYHCIFVEKGLHTVAKKQVVERILTAKDRGIKGAWKARIKLTMFLISAEAMQKEWLQLSDNVESPSYRVDASQFILRFLYWEKLYMALISPDDSSGQPPPEQILVSVREGMRIYEEGTSNYQDIEWQDAKSNGWDFRAYQAVRECQNELRQEIREALGHQIYDLSMIRNLLRIMIDTADSPRLGRQEANELIQPYARAIEDLFSGFLIGVSTFLLRIPARFEVFFPNGRFIAANFYNVRFQSSAFRSSWFTYSIFARTKFQDSNFSMSRFDRSEFFGADARNCSFSNSMFEQCGLCSAIFENTDFTGSLLRFCDLTGSTFQNSILQNMTIEDSDLRNCTLSDCKIVQTVFQYTWNPYSFPLRGLDFSLSTLFELSVKIENLPDVGKNGSDDEISAFHSLLSEADAVPQYHADADWEAYQAEIKAFQQRIMALKIGSPEHPFSDRLAEMPNGHEMPSHPVWKDIRRQAAVVMTECIFSRAYLPFFSFYRVNMEQSVFQDADMNNTLLCCAYMPGCIMERVNMREALLCGVVMRSAALEEAIFFGTTCALVNLEDASLAGMHASEARFLYCSFNRSDCTNIDLTRAVLHSCSFRDSILTRAELTGADFQYVRMDNCSANKMLASYTLFRECALTNAVLSQSSFNYAVFEDCDFTLASFSHSAVTNVKFCRCIFSNSDFTGTSFAQAEFDDCRDMGTAQFKGCLFIQSRFLGESVTFEKNLPPDSIIS